MRFPAFCILLAGLLPWLGGCSHSGGLITSRLPPAAVSAPDVELEQTPFFPQEIHQCGPAALATVLNHSGLSLTPTQLTDEVYLPGREGSLQIELLAAIRRHGRLPYPLEPELSALLEEVRAGRPVLVLQNLGLRSLPVWHYAVVIGYQRDRDRILLRSGTTRRKEMDAGAFLRSWTGAGHWALVVLHPGELPARPAPLPYLQAAAALEAVGRPRAALESFRTARSTWPQESMAWLGVANSLYALNRPGEAQVAYEQLLKRFPDHVIGHNNLAQLLAEQGCRQRALEVIEAAILKAGEDPQLAEPLRATRAGIETMPPDRPCRSPRVTSATP